MFPVLYPSGLIASSELSLIYTALLLLIIVVIPVFLLAFFFAWRYRASNIRALYLPEWEHGAMSELVWWAVPIEIVLVLGALTYTSTHELDPHRAIASIEAPLTIQVVALPWQWLFIYPEEGIATLNTLTIPVSRPVHFMITADAPMNSFWIPALGGQIYAMTGMSTTLNLIADHTGTFRGLSANYSGEGFNNMHFVVSALPAPDFNTWATETRTSPGDLTMAEYERIRLPSTSSVPVYYRSVAPDLYSAVLARFAEHHGAHTY
jgi:cytochrome o ubiquinol oxidase subunit 2